MVSSSKGESQRRPGRSLPGHQASSRERNGSATTGTATRPAKKKDAPFHLALSASLVELLDEGGKTDHRFRQLLYDFSTLGASLEVARAYLASQLGISPPQYNIAMIVANHLILRSAQSEAMRTMRRINFLQMQEHSKYSSRPSRPHANLTGELPLTRPTSSEAQTKHQVLLRVRMQSVHEAI